MVKALPAKVDPQDDRIVTVEELLERIPLSYPTIWRMCRDGDFPKPIQLTPARIGWQWSAVLAWIDERKRNPLAAEKNYGWRKNRKGAR